MERLDLAQIGSLEFRAPDETRWPALRLARDVMAAGGLTGAVFNAAKETALDGFLDGRLRFTEMAHVVEDTLDTLGHQAEVRVEMTLDNVARIDHLARQAAKAATESKAG